MDALNNILMLAISSHVGDVVRKTERDIIDILKKDSEMKETSAHEMQLALENMGYDREYLDTLGDTAIKRMYQDNFQENEVCGGHVIKGPKLG